MKSSRVIITYLFLINYFLFNAGKVFAQSCYGDLENSPNSIGYYLDCVLPSIWGSVQIVFTTIATVSLILFIFLFIYKREDSKFLETVPSRTSNLIFFILLVAGFGGTLISIFLNIFGLPSIGEYLNQVEQLINIASP